MAFAPKRLLLVGISISALFKAVVGAVMSSGDPRAGLLMNFVVGSTYYVQPAVAWGAAVLAVLALCVAPLTVRWIEALGLGAPVVSGLGVPVGRARFVVLLLAATLTAASTLLVNPAHCPAHCRLIVPHIARMSGGRRPLAQIWMSAVLGAALMVISECVGRQVLFPQEMPAGLVATLQTLRDRAHVARARAPCALTTRAAVAGVHASPCPRSGSSVFSLARFISPAGRTAPSSTTRFPESGCCVIQF